MRYNSSSWVDAWPMEEVCCILGQIDIDKLISVEQSIWNSYLEPDGTRKLHTNDLFIVDGEVYVGNFIRYFDPVYVSQPINLTKYNKFVSNLYLKE